MITNLIREKRKTLSIVITRNGEVEVKAPKSLPIAEVIKFVQSKEKWVLSRQADIKNRLAVNRDIIQVDKVLILGNKFEICFIDNLSEIKQEAGKLFLPSKYYAKKAEYIAKWLKKQAVSIVENRLLYFSANYKLSFNSISLINAKTRWGTCSSKKELAFNWRIIMLSPRLIDYIIVHELMHTLEQNHSEKFWKLVETVMPDYKKRKEELKKCSFILNLFR